MLSSDDSYSHGRVRNHLHLSPPRQLDLFAMHNPMSPASRRYPTVLIHEHFSQKLLSKRHYLQEMVIPVYLAPLDIMRQPHILIISKSLQ